MGSLVISFMLTDFYSVYELGSLVLNAETPIFSGLYGDSYYNS